MADLKPGDYIGLYLEDVLIHTGVLKDQGTMESGRKVYQVLLVKNIFQRNFPEVHFDADIRPGPLRPLGTSPKSDDLIPE